jgi:hypothetical protein
MHRHHADEKRGLNDQHALDHLQAAGIHGGTGLAGSAEGVNAGSSAGAAGPSGTPVAAGMGGGASGGVQAAAGQPQPPMPGAPAAAMA